MLFFFLADVNIYHFLLSSDVNKNPPSASQMPFYRVGIDGERLKRIPTKFTKS